MSETVTIQAHTSGVDRLAGIIERQNSAEMVEARTERDAFIAMTATVARQQSDLNALNKRFEEHAAAVLDARRPNWPVIIGGISFLPVVGAILVYLITSQIREAVDPIIQTQQLGVAQLHQNADDIAALHIEQAASTTADTESRNDRLQLNSRLSDLEKNLASSEATSSGNLAVVKDSLGEIETQFRAASDLRNQGRAFNTQIISLLWAKTFGTEFPTSTFYPEAVPPSGGVP